MKRILVLVAGSASLVGVLGVLPGCETVHSVHGWFLSGAVLTYQQYLSVDQAAVPAPNADSVIKTLGKPMEVHDRDGVIRAVDYHCYSLNGDLKLATFFFDENQKLVKKEMW